VRRFISHEELARDSRFRRLRSRNRLIASLPDDATIWFFTLGYPLFER